MVPRFETGQEACPTVSARSEAVAISDGAENPDGSLTFNVQVSSVVADKLGLGSGDNDFDPVFRSIMTDVINDLRAKESAEPVVESAVARSGKKIAQLTVGIGAANRLIDASLCPSGVTPIRELRVAKAEEAKAVLDNLIGGVLETKIRTDYGAAAAAKIAATYASAELLLSIAKNDMPSSSEVDGMTLTLQDVVEQVDAANEIHQTNFLALGHLSELAILNVVALGISYDRALPLVYGLLTENANQPATSFHGSFGRGADGLKTDVDMVVRHDKVGAGRTPLQIKMGKKIGSIAYSGKIEVVSLMDVVSIWNPTQAVDRGLSWRDQPTDTRHNAYFRFMQKIK